MTVRGIEDLLAEHDLFGGLSAEHVEVISGCGRNVVFEPGEAVFREGGAADTFYVVRRGRVSLQIAVGGRGPIVVETIGPGEVLGWSWIVPPYRWHFDARAEEVTRAIAFDGACLRGKFAADPALGYELLARFVGIVADRLQATRLRLLDLYGHRSDG